MPWWAWVSLGFGLILLELLTPAGFYLMFFGIGALALGALVSLHLPLPLWAEWVLFSGCSIVAMLLFRRPLLAQFHLQTRGFSIDGLIGETAIALEDIAVGATGRVELRGTSWNARNVGDQPLTASQRCTVEKRERLLLWVRAE